MSRGNLFPSSAKQQEKLWPPLDDSPTLGGLLSQLTKEELYTISTARKLKGMSALNKSELTSRLAVQFSEGLPQIFNLFDETRYKILKQILERGGRAFFSIDYDQLVYFRKRGLIFSGTLNEERVLLAPQEVLDVFRQTDGSSYREKVRRNSELIQFTQGLLFYYGTLSLVEYQDMVHHHLDASYKMSEMIELLAEAQGSYHTIRLGSVGISDHRVIDSWKIKEEHRARPDLPFFPFTKAQIMRAGEPDFIDRNFSFRSFVRFLQENYTINQEEAEWLVEDCVEGVLIGRSLQEIVEELQVRLEIPDMELLKKIVAQLVELMNNTKQWVLKGYAPREILQQREAPNQQKVGRNVACPCGSGKKYKKCCGNT